MLNYSFWTRGIEWGNVKFNSVKFILIGINFNIHDTGFLPWSILISFYDTFEGIGCIME